VLTTSVERLEGNNVKLTVTVSADEVDAGIESAYKSVAAKVKIPGFRPGKAPRPMIDTMVGREYIMQEATEELVNGSYPRALDLEELRPIESPEMDELPLVEPGAEYTYAAEITVRPEYDLSSTADFEVTAPPQEATQAEVDMQIDAARDRYATLVPVEGRGVEKGDFVLVSFVGTVDGEGYDGNTVDKYLYEMNAGLMPEQFDDGLLGAMPEQELRIEFEIPATSSVEEYVGKMAEFDVTVHEVKAKKLPEVTDEFALSVGGFESVDDMMTEVRKHLDLQAKSNHLQAKERALRELLASRLDGEIPQPMIDSRADTMLRDFSVMLDTRGTSLEQYFASTGMDMEQLEVEMKTQAEQAVREDLALESLFRALKLEITPEDIDQELADFAGSSDTTPEEARKRWEELGLMTVIREQIMHRKAVEWLMENSSVTVVTAGSDDDAPAEEKPAKKKAAPKKKAAKKAEEADESAASDEGAE